MTCRTLRMLYRDVPAMSCLPGCTDCCGPVPWSADEWARVAQEPAALSADRETMGNAVVPTVPGTLRCPFASAEGCTVYDRRPLVCRMFGVVRDARLTCPHGCGPKRKLSAEQGAALRHRYQEAMNA